MIGAFQAGRRRHPYKLQNRPPSLAVPKPGPHCGLLLLLLLWMWEETRPLGLVTSEYLAYSRNSRCLCKGQDVAC